MFQARSRVSSDLHVHTHPHTHEHKSTSCSFRLLKTPPHCRPSSSGALVPRPGPAIALQTVTAGVSSQCCRGLLTSTDYVVTQLPLPWKVISKLPFLQREIRKHLLFPNQMSCMRSSPLRVWRRCRTWWIGACRWTEANSWPCTESGFSANTASLSCPVPTERCPRLTHEVIMFRGFCKETSVNGSSLMMDSLGIQGAQTLNQEQLLSININNCGF